MYDFLLPAAFFSAGWAATRAVLPGVLHIISEAGFLRPNYRAEAIPCGAGVVFFLGSLAALAAAPLFLPPEMGRKSAVFLLALSGYALLGLMDDAWGNGLHRGLAGHIKCLLRGRVTTGSVKALAGGAIAVFIAASGGSGLDVPLNALIIALSVNMLNLLDLRPGRAGKGFLAAAAVMAAAFPFRPETALLAIVAGSLAAYLPTDLRAGAMMGDAGSNTLGAVLGISAAWLLDFNTKAAYLAVLVFFHLLAEKYSLTSLISSNRVLSYLDRLGRK